MPRIKVTAKGIEALVKQPHPRRVDYFDSAHPGLCLTIGPKSATWYYFRRIDGKLTRINLGQWPDLGIAASREAAADVEATIAAGKHPKAEQARERAKATEARTLDHERIVSTAAALWWKSHKENIALRTAADYQRALDEFTATHGDHDIGTITRGTIVRHLDKVKARSPSAANHAAVVLRLLFGFAADRFDLPVNPAAGIKNPTRQKIRQRTLDRDELRVLWKACELAGYPYGHALRLAICTGQRIGEVGGILRSDMDGSGDYWQQTRNKSDRRIDIYIAPHARAVLDDCPDFGPGEPFFTSGSLRDEKDGGPNLSPIHSDRWNKAIPRHITPRIAEAAQALGLDPIKKPWTPHDLRRTVRTGLTGWAVGVSPDTAERVLNHSMGGLRAVYDHADYRPHVAEALRAWDQEIDRVLAGKISARQEREDLQRQAPKKASKRRTRAKA